MAVSPASAFVISACFPYSAAVGFPWEVYKLKFLGLTWIRQAYSLVMSIVNKVMKITIS